MNTSRYLIGILTLSLFATFSPHSHAALLSGGQPNPSEPSLKLWLKADALGLSDGDPVSTWTASNAAGNDATLSTGSPTFIAGSNTTGFNGQPVVRFDGVNDGMNINGVSSAVTVIIVAKLNGTNTAASRQTLFSGNPFSNPSPWDYAGRTTGPGDPNSYWVYFHNAVETFSTNPLDLNTHITFHEAPITATDNSSFWVFGYTIYNDGDFVTPVVDTTDVTGTLSQDVLALGFTTVHEYANADIAEMLIYDRILTSDEKSGVYSYLDTKYIPEPASMTLLALGGAVMLRRRRRSAAV